MEPFSAHDWRDAYAKESSAIARKGAEIACVLAVVLVPAFALLDRIIFPQQAALLLTARLACTIVVAVIWLLLRGRCGARHPLALGVLLAVTVGLMIDGMTWMTGREHSPYYAGTNLVLLAVALLMPWPPAWTLGTSALLVGGYVTPIVAGGVADGRLLVSNLSFLVSTALIAVVSSIRGDRLRRREFGQRGALVEALRHKSEFMARMSHELRTPLHVMIGYADVLLEDALAAGAAHARPFVERMRSQGVLLHRLISDLLDYAKVEAGKMDVHPEPVAVDVVLRDVTDGFRPLSERKGVALRTACAAELPDVTTDRQRLEQIVTNLIGNAVKFTEAGAVTVEARAIDPDEKDPLAGFASLDAAATPIEGAVVILVHDTGIGIRAADVARLADDFQQFDAADAKYGGTGLGLSIARRLARRLGGRLAVRSRHGEGSTFALVLPREPPDCRDAA